MCHFAAERRETVKYHARALATPGAALKVDTSANDHKHICSRDGAISCRASAHVGSFGRLDRPMDDSCSTRCSSSAWLSRSPLPALRGGAQCRERPGIEHTEEQIVDRADLGADAIDLEPAGRRKAQAARRAGPADSAASAADRAAPSCRSPTAMKALDTCIACATRADTDAALALQVRDSDQHAVLRAADAHARGRDARERSPCGLRW